MEALFIGQTYIDVTFLTDRIPTGDEKVVARDYAVSFGGNAVSAAFCCAKLGIVPDLMTSLADDWLAPHVPRHGGEVRNFGSRPEGEGVLALLRDAEPRHARDHPLPRRPLSPPGSAARHHRLPRAASRRASGRRGDPLRETLPRDAASSPRSTAAGCAPTRWSCLDIIDVAICSERLCEQLKLSPQGAMRAAARQRLPHRRRHVGRHAASSGTTSAATSGTCRRLRCRSDEVIDTNGAGDIFHGAYMYSYLTAPKKPWEAHFRFARAASAHSVRFLGIEHSLPTRADVVAAERAFREAA